MNYSHVAGSCVTDDKNGSQLSDQPLMVKSDNYNTAIYQWTYETLRLCISYYSLYYDAGKIYTLIGLRLLGTILTKAVHLQSRRFIRRTLDTWNVAMMSEVIKHWQKYLYPSE